MTVSTIRLYSIYWSWKMTMKC